MVLRLGTGSTAAFVVAKLGQLLSTGQLTNIIDEVDPNLDLVKSGGGPLLREKMVEDKFVVVVDDSKFVSGLYSYAGKEIAAFEGVVEHGLFLDMTTAVIIAGKEGVSVKSK
ncbi:hypothetical protein RND71_000939 [Anisodus tanguticus]|uniref:ribose-5-phosphate isomerase n=1 Tax=Anisodus tanguticus TaxID=243964 RepID=A0AAE1SZW5_9SOLA|nr:hypothetical protein RND71_000939 [Anisodus tanguticus]